MRQPHGKPKPKSLSQLAYECLENEIVTMKLPPGILVTEAQLRDALGLGRTPLREAMQRLQWEGLIEVRPRAGIRVTDMRQSDFAKVMRLRHTLEPELAAAAIAHSDKAQRSYYVTLREAFLKSEADNDRAAFLRADKALDTYNAELADEPFLALSIAPLQTHSRRFWYRYFSANGVGAAVQLHLPLLDACHAGDVKGARAACQTLLAALLACATELAAQR
ncbi:MAG: GntR family transcriptional regulator [Paracoccaceae bacterium]